MLPLWGVSASDVKALDRECVLGADQILQWVLLSGPLWLAGSAANGFASTSIPNASGTESLMQHVAFG